MAGTEDKWAGRRFGRCPAWLFVIGLVSSLGATSAIAAAIVSTSPSGPGRALSIRVAPTSRTVTPGTAASYTVRVARDHHGAIGLSGRTRLSVRVSGLPAGSDISFSPAPGVGTAAVARATTTLTITTATDTPPGTYEVELGARRQHRSGKAALALTVSSAPSSGPPTVAPTLPGPAPEVVPPGVPVVPVVAPDAFTISGVLPNSLTPGTGEPLDLTLTNLESTDLQIASLGVQVTGVSGPQTDPAHTCDSEDFSVGQFAGAPGFTLPASSSADLGELGIDPSDWPTISMLDLAVNQNGCMGASLVLSFSGTATEVAP
jgi:hypothetical protein